MDREAFDKELVKYKIIRLEDYYRPRSKRAEVKITQPAKITNEPSTSSSTTASKSRTVVPVNLSASEEVEEEIKELPFWELMEKNAREIFTAEETKKFMSALRLNYEDISEYVNLEDLNSAATLLNV